MSEIVAAWIDKVRDIPPRKHLEIVAVPCEILQSNESQLTRQYVIQVDIFKIWEEEGETYKWVDFHFVMTASKASHEWSRLLTCSTKSQHGSAIEPPEMFLPLPFLPSPKTFRRVLLPVKILLLSWILQQNECSVVLSVETIVPVHV